MMKIALVLATSSLFSGVIFAHEQHKGPNGGELIDAGAYHIEVVGRDAALDVFVNDETDKALDTRGFKALAIIVINGATQRISLEPTVDYKKLSGISASAITTVKGVVQLTGPDGKTSTGQVK